MASSSRSSSQSWNHDVFLSFRGEDTRETFVDHLYSALVQKGINAYKDRESLPRGETIGPALLKAVQESRIAVIIFSEDFASSSWCLDEVTYIMRCRDERGQIVMPVFYHVDPSEVRKQKGKYGEAIAKHELEKNKNVESWRRALNDAGNIAGWDLNNIADQCESKCIKEIVHTISNTLFSLISNVSEDLIGIKIRLQHLKSQLEIGSSGVRMVGIWGVGGGGKTTLASTLYNEISYKFDGHCFIKNIRDESSKYGLEKLQEKLLSCVLKLKPVDVGRFEEGRDMIKTRLRHRKVLLVLDDVDHLDHLKALAGSYDWFGDGSRIIITTRDNHILNAHKVNVIHNISLLNHDEGTMLFCKHAPQGYRPREDYEVLSKDVVRYAGGLPLALIVLGSFLCDKDINEWKGALARLKQIPDTNIVEKLKISYDGLKPVEKELFLDIVCFFRGEKKEEAIDILHVCDFHPVIGIKVLIQKALICILDGKFDMHDLIQEMGHYIVSGKHPNNPEKHSRVWLFKDVQNICSLDATTKLDKIEAISIFSDLSDPLPSDNHHVVENMKNLRWIDWRGHNASSLPTNFPTRGLRCLILSGSQQRKLWSGYKCLPNLRMIKLHGLKNLIKTPDFGGLPNLERFMLHQCPRLKEIDSSIKRVERLVYLHIKGCDNFSMFQSITGIKKLKTLSLSECNKLYKRRKNVTSYKQYCTNFFVTRTTSCCINLYGKHDLEEPFFPYKGMKHIGLQFISTALRKLILKNCHLGDEEINCDVWDLPNLQQLDLSWNMFSRLNFSRLQLPRLKWLDVSLCTSLVELSELPSSIAILRADYCYNLKTIGDISNCKWLWKVSFMGVNKLGTSGDQELIDTMSQGNAIEHHFMSLALEHQVRQMCAPSQFPRNRFILWLPHNWHNDYCGFLIYNVIDYQEPYVTIIIEQELDEVEDNYQNKLLPHPLPPPTYIGYVSFSSLRHATWLNSTCNVISFSIHGKFEVELVSWKSKNDHRAQKTNDTSVFSEFWDEESEDRKTFTIRNDSKSSINILWRPC